MYSFLPCTIFYLVPAGSTCRQQCCIGSIPIPGTRPSTTVGGFWKDQLKRITTVIQSHHKACLPVWRYPAFTAAISTNKKMVALRPPSLFCSLATLRDDHHSLNSTTHHSLLRQLIPAQIHHLGPGCHKVFNKLLFGICTRIYFCQCP